MTKSPWVAYTHHAVSVNAESGKLSLEAADPGEDFEDIGMDEQVIYKCLGSGAGGLLSPEEAEAAADECCQAYRIVKRDGVDCGTCQKTVKEIWFRTDDDAKCGDCFE